MQEQRQRVTITPGLGQGVRVMDRITDSDDVLDKIEAVMNGEPSPEPPAPSAIPDWVRNNIATDLQRQAGRAVCHELLSNFADSLLATFQITSDVMADVLCDVAGEFHPLPNAERDGR